MNRHDFTLRDLELKLPPPNKSTNKHHPDKQLIVFSKDGRKGVEQEVVIVATYLLGFSFCFQGNFTHCRGSLLHPTVVMDPLDIPIYRWTPPRWYVPETKGHGHSYEIKEVSWDAAYKNRFTEEGKKNLLAKLRTKVHQQTQLRLSS